MQGTVNWPPYGDPAWPKDRRGRPLPPNADGSPRWPNRKAYDRWHRWYTGTVPPAPKTGASGTRAAGTAAVVVAIVVGIIWWNHSSSSSNTSASKVSGTSLSTAQLDGAYESCKGSVNAQLKAPASASYPNFFTNTTDIHIVNNGGGAYTISSQVDSDNSFGAKLRALFTCNATTTDGGSTWTSDATLDPQ